MGWNYRVLRHKHEDEEWFAIHEVYYNDKGEPDSCTVDPVDVRSREGVEGIRAILDMMHKAIGQPVLDYDSFEEKENK